MNDKNSSSDQPKKRFSKKEWLAQKEMKRLERLRKQAEEQQAIHDATRHFSSKDIRSMTTAQLNEQISGATGIDRKVLLAEISRREKKRAKKA